MRALVIMSGVIVLAGCMDQGEVIEDPVQTGNAGSTNATAVANEVMPPAPAEALTEIPAAFQGRWGMVPADCEPGRSDAKGLMTVEAGRLAFYESRATPKALTAAGGERISGDFAFSGEGQTWEKTQTLTLSDGGNTLTRAETDPAGNFTYAKCPAA